MTPRVFLLNACPSSETHTTRRTSGNGRLRPNYGISGTTAHTICVIGEILREENLLPDAEWRNFMGSIDILRQIESSEVKELIRKKEPHLDVW